MILIGCRGSGMSAYPLTRSGNYRGIAPTPTHQILIDKLLEERGVEPNTGDRV